MVKISGLAVIFLCSLVVSESLAQEGLPSGYQYVFPGPGAEKVYQNSTIILRFERMSPGELESLERVIKVSGEESGIHPGETIIASDNRTLIFKSGKGYKPGERVTVTIDPGLAEFNNNTIKPLNYDFTVLDEAVVQQLIPDDDSYHVPINKKKASDSGPVIMSNGVSVPSDFPQVNITVNKNPSSDYIFLNNWDPPNYNIIFNTSGEPVWYWKTPDRYEDFKVQPNGWITMHVPDGYGGDGQGFIAFNEDFEFIKSIRAANGYTIDKHDFLMLPDNGYILIGKKETLVDMSQYVEGGHLNATVLETCIQEFTADDQLIFIWRPWDHFDIRDLEFECLTCNNIRFPHINAVDTDDDGHILISSRHLSEISKIHRTSGDFIWRMSGIPGSPNNDFNFDRDPFNGFRGQHDIRALGNNRYTLFDNGILHNPFTSRALEYAINTDQMTATLVWEHINETSTGFVRHLGNAQRLSNGNTHVNWAYGNIYPIATEVTTAGEKEFEMWVERCSRSYRTFRHPWEGECQVPYLLVEPQDDHLTLIFNKFGDNNVDYYNIYGGTAPNPTSLIGSSGSTLKNITDLQNGVHYYYRVTAVDKNGTESGYSNEEDLVIRDPDPGSNLILNGDFTNALDSWIFVVDITAVAEVQVGDSVCRIELQDGGSGFDDVQLKQQFIPLIHGEEYVFEFDAWSDTTRFIEIIIGKAEQPFTYYNYIGFTALESGSKRYSYSFEMTELSDLNACVLINAGNTAETIYLDNISLRMDVSSMTDDRLKKFSKFLLHQNYPNPFSVKTRIEYQLAEASFVKLIIYNTLGQKVEEFIFGEQTSGSYSSEIQLGDFSAGMYFYSLEATAVHSGSCYQKTNRMILIK
jgi:hypothetical protein